MAARAALLKEDGFFMRWKWYLPSTGEKMGLSALTGISPSKVVAAQKSFLPPMLQCHTVVAPNLFGTGGLVSWKTILHGVGCSVGWGVMRWTKEGGVA